jgi:hypothetical protein
MTLAPLVDDQFMVDKIFTKRPHPWAGCYKIAIMMP